MLFLFLSAAVGAQEIIQATTKERSEGTQIAVVGPTVAADGDESEDNAHNYRLLQSNEFFVDSPYLQEKGELQHTFSFTRIKHHSWAMTFTEEAPLWSDKHQLSLSIPANLTWNNAGDHRGFGDVQLEYNYGLIGSSSSRITVSPGIGLTLPTGSWKKELGAGGPAVSFNLPVGVMLGKRFGSNSAFEITYTRSAKNEDGDKADTLGYEFGQSFVWYAKPKLNFLIDAVWERSQEITGPGSKKNENEFMVSPGVRWAYVLKNGLVISPGVAVPAGVGPSRGEYGVFFYLSFEHLIGRGR